MELVERLLADLQSRQAEGRAQNPAWAELRRRLTEIARLFIEPEDIDDVVQTVALKLFDATTLKRMRAVRSPKGYAVMMVRNAAIDLGRSRARQPVQLPAGNFDLVDLAPLPDQILERETRREDVERLLDGLSDAEMLLLHLRFWENLSFGDVAQRLGLPYSTVAVRMFRLLRRLRSKLESPP